MLPLFQPQNPALNGYPLGWQSCTAYSGAMAAAYDRQVRIVMSGEALRRKTGDTTGGLNLGQIDAALNAGWHINLAVYYRLPWATFAKLITGGMGGVLQGWYAPIADSGFDAGRGFRGNHAIFVPPGWGAMDPLADGRAKGVYKYSGQAYPQSLLRSFAGQLNIAATGQPYRRLGDGYVYAAMTRDNVHTYQMNFLGGSFWVYELGPDGAIKSREAKRFSGPTSAACLPAQWAPWPGHNGRSVCKMLNGALAGRYVAIPQSNVKLEVLP